MEKSNKYHYKSKMNLIGLRDRKKVPKGGSHRCWAVSQMEGSDQRARKGEVGVRASV